MKTKTIQLEIPDGKEAKWVDGVLTLVDEQPKDITHRIKTFDDAYNWCNENHKSFLTGEHDMVVMDRGVYSYDLIAYLKLRIITAALNEGWVPTSEEDEKRYYATYNSVNEMVDFDCEDAWRVSSNRMVFKSKYHAIYAASQFRDIYADFFGCKKGGQQ